MVYGQKVRTGLLHADDGSSKQVEIIRELAEMVVCRTLGKEPKQIIVFSVTDFTVVFIENIIH